MANKGQELAAALKPPFAQETEPSFHGRIDSLDALRGLAITSVLVLHLHAYLPSLWSELAWWTWPDDVRQAVSMLWIGVDLFYVLSGYFIGSAVLRPATWQILRFIRARATRIFPAYYVSLAFTLWIAPDFSTVASADWANVALHVLMLHTYQTWTFSSFNPPYWTLGVECGFYVLMVCIATCWRRQSLLVILAFVGTALAWKFAVFHWVAIDQRFFWSAQLPGALDEFAMGMGIAWLHRRGLLEYATRRVRQAPLAAVCVGATLAFFCLIFYVRWQAFYWTWMPSMVLSRLVLGFGFALMVAGAAMAPAIGVWHKSICRSGLPAVGRMSYSLYLLHMPVIYAFHRYLPDGFGSVPVLVLAVVLCTVLIAWLSYRMVERVWHPTA